MWKPMILPLFVAAALLPITARAEPLDYKFGGGDWFLDVQHVAKQNITVLGHDTENNTVIHLVLKVHVVKSDATGAVLEHTILLCDDTSSSPGKAEEKGLFKGLRNQKFTVVLKPHNDAIEIEGADELAEPVFGDEAKNAKPKDKKFMADMLAYILRLHVVEFYTPTPAQAGEWSHTLDMKLQSMAQIQADRKYAPAGTKTVDGKTLEAIHWTGKITVSPLKDEAGVLPFKVTELKLVGDPVDTGTILWDPATGRPAQVDSEQVTSLTMKMDINGQVVDGAAKTNDKFTIKAMEKYEEKK